MTSSRRRMTAEARREQLLDACAAIVDLEGFHAVTIERVANECGVTRTVVYQQFGGLDGMLDALVQRASERAGAAFADAAAGEPSVRSAMSRVLEAVDADPATWRMFLAPQIGPPALASSLARGRAMIRDVSMSAFEDGPGAPEDPELASAHVAGRRRRARPAPVGGPHRVHHRADPLPDRLGGEGAPATRSRPALSDQSRRVRTPQRGRVARPVDVATFAPGNFVCWYRTLPFVPGA